jgi:peptidoglycan L-alanyl-D-glutamate endopeptidase CwlK
MDHLTIERIKLLHPAVREEVLNAYANINKTLLGRGVRLRFSYTLRSNKEQKELYAIGRFKPGKIITNAKEGLSVHNYGLAFDIVLLTDKNNDGVFETASWDINSDWMEVVSCFKRMGWTWGGDWKSFRDYPHLEKTFGFTPRQLLARYAKGNTFNEIIDGKTYTWINL